jgi:pimeloyl-ACP methyl ester carboxylesterase
MRLGQALALGWLEVVAAIGGGREARAAEAAITVGGLTLTRCVEAYDGYCGSIERALDPSGSVPGTLAIGFEYYPRRDQARPAEGTIIAQEGGPGYSTTGSRDGYLRMLAPLRRTRDIVLIDKRGTGKSSPIDCGPLQRAYDPGLLAVRACGVQLGRRAWLYRTALAADDTEAVLAALQTGKVDYYGDSYGTYFGTVFAVRHPERLRTLVLDSAYPLRHAAPLFHTEILNGSIGFEKVCARSVPCAALGPSTTARLTALLDRLRRQPVSGVAPGAQGEPRTVTADAPGLFLVVANVGNTLIAYRDLDAAARAYLQEGDALPLLRLVAEARDAYSGGGPASQFSTGLADAVICGDYRQLYDMRAPIGERKRQYQAALAQIAREHPRVYSPFTIEEAAGAQMDAEGLDTCTVWPAAPPGSDPGAPVPAGSVFPAVPTLVLSGELDSVTSTREGALATGQFPDATFVVVKNTGHETAIGDGGVFVPPYGGDLAQCAAPIVRRFIASGGDPGDTRCVARVRPIRTVPAFVRGWAEVAPLAPLPGNEAGEAALRLASAAAETAGDALARYFVTLSGLGAGLRGGRFRLEPTRTGYAIRLEQARWTEDLAVSGTIDWDQVSGAIVARLDLDAAGHAGTIELSWNDRDTDAVAHVSGTVDGTRVEAARIAP